MNKGIDYAGQKRAKNFLVTKRMLFGGLTLVIVIGVSLSVGLFVQRVLTKPGPSKVWSFQVGDIVEHPPLVVNGIVYLVSTAEPSSKSTLYALDAASGQKLWTFQPEGRIDPVDSWLMVANGIIYVVVNDSHGDSNNSDTLDALDAVSGHEQWSLHTEDLISFAPTSVNGAIYITSHDTIYALDARSGRQRWAEQIRSLSNFAPIVADGMAYIVSAGLSTTTTIVSALDVASGHRRWSHAIERSPTAPLTAVNGMVYLETSYDDGTLYALDAFSGSQKWNFQPDIYLYGLVVSNGLVYVNDENGDLYALNALSGSKKWVSRLGAFSLALPTVVNGLIYLVVNDGTLNNGTLYALDIPTGHIRWTQHDGYYIGSFVFPQPTMVVANGTVYGNTSDGYLYALNALSGSTKWSYVMQGYASVAPTISNDRIYVMSSNHLEAIRPPATGS